MRKTPSKRLNKTLLKLVLQYPLTALDFLHTEADIAHTGMSCTYISQIRHRVLCRGQELSGPSAGTRSAIQPRGKSSTKQEQYIHLALLGILQIATGVRGSSVALEKPELGNFTKSQILEKRSRIYAGHQRSLS
ncbi:protein kinase [Histoplasma capsulatum G186AR]|uniref:Protein kinase n=1 Tax=Ajellomyces capsulatus (strain G186AR / H82 / ATCC MYA-2454 / RMSCC 2432) TaxID=447093 RepID=C0NSW1_AJECG|nr:protein kinase [Histoplasma capsulatum G186AR]EEH05122.1 protein kinase [Histoplasma capsulatum G186AR]